MSANASVDWPKINTVGWLRMAEFASELATRFEDVDAASVGVAVPTRENGQDLPTPAAGTEFFVGWSMDRGAIEVPVRFDKVATSRVPIWNCHAIGEPAEIQRRRFVRVSVNFDVTLNMYEGSAGVQSRAVDLSEGGMRVAVDRLAIDPGARHFNLYLPLPQEPVDVTAEVVWWGNLREDNSRTIGLRFSNMAPSLSDTIRRQVFAIQLEQRRQQ